jgi:xanthine dehydrogenase accessory factor
MSLILIRGAGDIGTAVGILLYSLGHKIVYTELPRPHTLRWAVAFSEAVYRKTWEVQGIHSRFTPSPKEAREIAEGGEIAVLAPEGQAVSALRPDVLVDARMAKKNLGTRIEEAPLVIGLGPGFQAGVDCHFVIETLDGLNLGRVIREGGAEPPTHLPCAVEGIRQERVVRAPRSGEFRALRTIGDLVEAGELVAEIHKTPVLAPIRGVIRGILHSGLWVSQGMKVVEIDPRRDPSIPFKISERSLRIASAVAEALRLSALSKRL